MLIIDALQLHRPHPEGEYVLHCDASNVGLGNVRTRKFNGEERVIAFASRALKQLKTH